MSMEWNDFHAKASNLASYLIDVRRFLHRNPELSWQEYRTSAYLQAQLQANGISVTKNVTETGFFIELGPESETMIAWRADMDALAIQDAKDCVYKSAFDGMAHLCGHDVHSTIALGVALVLHQVDLKKRIRIFWQPAEEVSPSGAPKMIEHGVLESVSALFALHVDPTMRAGKWAINSGYETASYDGVHVSLKSASTVHSARPHLGADLLWITTKLLQDWYALAGRITDARDASVLTFCQISGGTAINVMPDRLEFGGTLRCVSNQEREKIKRHLLQSAAYLASLHGITIDVTFSSSCPAIKNDQELAQKATQILNPVSQVVQTRQSMGAEDFAWYTERVPCLFMRLGTQHNESTAFPLHHSKFDIDESVIPKAVANIAFLLSSF